MATDTQTAREKLGLDRPGGDRHREQQEVPKRSALDRALEKAQAEYDKKRDVVVSLGEQERALQGKREVLGATLAREGKLTRAQRSELASVNGQLKKLGTPKKRANVAFGKASDALNKVRTRIAERNEAIRVKAREKADAELEREKDANRRKLDRRIAALEARAVKAAGVFVQLPEGARPSRGAGKDAARPHLTYGYMTKEGRGKSARWVLVVTDSYGMAVLPLAVTGTLPPIKGGLFIPSEALKAIDKTRAFKLTKKGGIQPVAVTTQQSTRVTEPAQQPGAYVHNPAQVEGWARSYTVTDVGTGFLVPDEPPTTGGKFIDHTQFVPSKPPAKVNTLEWAVNPTLLKQFAEAIGAGSGDMGNVVVTFDLSKVGKASDGRRVTRPVTIHRYDQSAARPVEGAAAVLMPVKLAERRK